MRRPAAAFAAVLALATAGCGGDGDRLKVSAAASLKPAFERYAADRDGEASFSFAGSDELAAQIRRGGRPAVFASANVGLATDLWRERLVERPVVFARNRVVIAVRPGSPVRSLSALGRRGTAIAIGAAGVPVGDYARVAIGGLPPGQRDAILRNVRSEEPDVAGVAAKVIHGAVDAGFVYRTDVLAAEGRLAAVELPPGAAARVAYAAAVVRDSGSEAEARAFVRGLTGPAGRRALLAAGFELP